MNVETRVLMPFFTIVSFLIYFVCVTIKAMKEAQNSSEILWIEKTEKKKT